MSEEITQNQLDEILKVKKELSDKITSLLSERSHFFQHSPFAPEVDAEFEKQFPKEQYGENFGGMFEAWELSSMMKKAMQIGFELGKNPEKMKNLEKSYRLAFELDKNFEFAVVKEMRTFRVDLIVFPLNPNQISLNEYDDKALKKYDFNLVKKAYSSWALKTFSNLNQIKEEIKKL